MYQKSGGMTGLPEAFEAMSCTTQRPANSSTPRYPISFQGVIVTP